jgi:hypothetical protein
MATAQEIQDLEAKLNAAKKARLENVGDLAIAPVEEVTLAKFNYHGDALRLQDPIKYAAIQRNLLVNFVKTQMQDGTDYGLIPGVKEKCLFKPGAERLATLFNYSVSVDCVERQADYDKGFFAFTYKAIVRDCVGRPMAECEGHCNSKEKKYAYRWVNERYATPAEKQAAINNKNGSLQVPNDDIYSIVNTLMKMAQKRAVVGAVILACNASSFFKNAENLTEMTIPENRPMWDGETIDAEIIPQAPSPKEKPAKSQQQSIVARICAVARDAGFTPEARDAMLSAGKFASKNDVTESDLPDVLSWFTPDKAAEWNAAFAEPVPVA